MWDGRKKEAEGVADYVSLNNNFLCQVGKGGILYYHCGYNGLNGSCIDINELDNFVHTSA